MQPKIDTQILGTPLKLRNITIKNRFLRSATYDAYGDEKGFPIPGLADFFTEPAEGGVGALVSGTSYVTPAGHIMQPLQYGIDDDNKIQPWRDITDKIHTAVPDVVLIMQISHAGRQTKRKTTGLPVVGASKKRCTYYRQKVKPLDTPGIETIIRQFGQAARRAKAAGFDGVQLHACHGYLIHQFLSPWTNTRTDQWADRPLFMEKIIENIKDTCGGDYPVLVKMNYAEERSPGIELQDAIQTVKRLEKLQVDAVEISSGTMEYALNVMRGGWPLNTLLEVNPMFHGVPWFIRRLWKKYGSPFLTQHFQKLTTNFNLEGAVAIKKETTLPVYTVGGIRTARDMVHCITEAGVDGVALCRPLIFEPDLPRRILDGSTHRARCTSCNLCTVKADLPTPVTCHICTRPQGAFSRA